MRLWKAIRRLCAAIVRREQARFDSFTASNPDELVEASIRFGLESRVVRRWWSILGGHVGTMFRLSLGLPSDLVETSPEASRQAFPAPARLSVVR